MSTTFRAPTRGTSQEFDEPTHPVQRALQSLTHWLAAHSVTALRLSLGVVILGFGLLKYFPGASPAEGLVMETTDLLTMGMVSGTLAVVATAVIETVIGMILITGRFLEAGMVMMTGWLVGILSPVVLLTADLFPGGLPTLTAQYVLKDIILVAAAMVVAAHTLGARMSVAERP